MLTLQIAAVIITLAQEGIKKHEESWADEKKRVEEESEIRNERKNG